MIEGFIIMFMSMRDWQLQQLGIMQLILRNPIVLQNNEITISIPENVHLIIITKHILALEDLFISDVLRTLKLNLHQILQFTPNHATMISHGSCCNSWQMGVTIETKLRGWNIYSPDLDELKNNATAKNRLWQQICTCK